MLSAAKLTGDALDAAAQGDCLRVRALDASVRAASYDYYLHVFATYPQLRLCLVKSAR